jgi:hypothetical protein
VPAIYKEESEEMQFGVNVPVQTSSQRYSGCYETFSKKESISLDVSHNPESAGESGKVCKAANIFLHA